MDRPAERRLAALKRWRGERARELALDPGVLCPNSALEAMAVRNPARVEELRDVAGLKGWFVREFGREIVKELAAAPAEEPGE
jgi:ribonuclease D